MLYKCVRIVVRVVVGLFLKVHVSGLEEAPSHGGFILCCNHVSAWDPVIIFAKLERQIVFLSKAELFKIKPLKFLLKKLGMIPVDRGKGNKSAIRAAVGLVESGGVLGVFPEGTRSKNGKLLPPKSGVALIAFSSKSNILPVGVTYAKARTLKNFWRKEVFLRFGKLICFDELVLQSGLPGELRKASRTIMNSIEVLVEDQEER